MDENSGPVATQETPENGIHWDASPNAATSAAMRDAFKGLQMQKSIVSDMAKSVQIPEGVAASLNRISDIAKQQNGLTSFSEQSKQIAEQLRGPMAEYVAINNHFRDEKFMEALRPVMSQMEGVTRAMSQMEGITRAMSAMNRSRDAIAATAVKSLQPNLADFHIPQPELKNISPAKSPSAQTAPPFSVFLVNDAQSHLLKIVHKNSILSPDGTWRIYEGTASSEDSSFALDTFPILFDANLQHLVSWKVEENSNEKVEHQIKLTEGGKAYLEKLDKEVERLKKEGQNQEESNRKAFWTLIFTGLTLAASLWALFFK